MYICAITLNYTTVLEENIIQQYITSAKEYHDREQFHEAIAELQKIVCSEENENDIVYYLLSVNYMKLGDIACASENIQQAIKIKADFLTYTNLLQEIDSLLVKRKSAIDQISGGQHDSEAIHFIKENMKQLIENRCFKAAKDQLSLLAIARKSRTTNILWIGDYLREIYFHPKADFLRIEFDHLLLSEITFYYLKSCKLFEPEYEEIQGALKKIKKKNNLSILNT